MNCCSRDDNSHGNIIRRTPAQPLCVWQEQNIIYVPQDESIYCMLSDADNVVYECMGCVYYPVCLGECPAIRLKNKQQGKTFVCNASVKEHIEFAIKDYCLRTINNKKLS